MHNMSDIQKRYNALAKEYEQYMSDLATANATIEEFRTEIDRLNRGSSYMAGLTAGRAEGHAQAMKEVMMLREVGNE
jgi:uncharacterized protein YPO0396